jgi:N utilization substance protein A
MEQNVTLPRPELIQMADVVARDKGIDKESVLTAMEQAIAKAGRSKYGVEHDVRAFIDRKTGEIRLARYIEVVNDGEVENEITQLPLSMAVKKKADVQVGEFLVDPLPPIDFGRIAAGTAKQVIIQKVREAERTRQYEEYKDKVGEMINGTVKRIEIGNVIVDLGKAEAVLRRDELIPRETFRTGDRIRAYIIDVREEIRGPQIFLSRTCPDFMAKLFTQEVPEIYDGIIEIKGVARDPGSRAKMAVLSKDPSIDPVGACVGMRGARVQAVVNELQGEKIDIIEFSSDNAAYIVNSLAPAEVTKVIMDSDNNHIEVVVPENQLSLAIGRRGQNVRLASQLTGWHIDIVTEAEEAETRQKEIKRRSQMFIDALDVEDVIAHILVAEGFQSLEDVAYVPLDDLAEIEGFDEDLAAELQSRAVKFLEKKKTEIAEKCKELKIDDSLSSFEGLNDDVLVKLGEAGIKTLDDLADLSGDELREIAGEGVYTASEANGLIMKAREHWFEAEKAETGDTNS